MIQLMQEVHSGYVKLDRIKLLTSSSNTQE